MNLMQQKLKKLNFSKKYYKGILLKQKNISKINNKRIKFLVIVIMIKIQN